MSKSSIEEQVEDIAKKQLSEIKYYTKTEVINSEIEKALKTEFSRGSFEEASVSNIVTNAQIPRGSFYQYFESKEDLLRFYIK